MKLSKTSKSLMLALLCASSVFAAQTSENSQRLKKALKQYPEADANGDGVLTMKEAQDFKKKKGNKATKKQVNYPVKPTFANEKYGDYDRNILDFWQADIKKPGPLLVYIHGGGFSSGSKEKLAGRGIIEKALKKGIHVASINYRYKCTSAEDLKDPQRTGLAGCFLDGARAIQHIKYKASEWNVDKERIIVFGSSAGGGIALFVGFYDDLADPDAKDKVLRESSRVYAIGHMSSQPTYIIEKWKDILGYSREDLEGVVTMEKAELPTNIKMGFSKESDLETELGKKYLSIIDMQEHADPNDPPVFIFNSGKDAMPKHYGHIVHHPKLSMHLDQVCKTNKIESKLVLGHGKRLDAYDELFQWCMKQLGPN